MKKIYVVSRGSYSDYRVEALFSTEEKADNYISATKARNHSWNDPFKEEFVLDCPRKIWTKKYVSIEKNGAALVYYTDVDIYDRPGFNGWDNTKSPPALNWIVQTKSDKRAIKVANEKRAQIIALGLWGKDLNGAVV
jgi:hypothetical protein